MDYLLRPAIPSDKPWLDALRRVAYQRLFEATWGGWDEARHVRHFEQSWETGNICVIMVDGAAAGMVQVIASDTQIEIAEMQILPAWQCRGLGSAVLRALIANEKERPLTLRLGLKNNGAYRLYKRLGFREVARSATHISMDYQSPGAAHESSPGAASP